VVEGKLFQSAKISRVLCSLKQAPQDYADESSLQFSVLLWMYCIYFWGQ